MKMNLFCWRVYRFITQPESYHVKALVLVCCFLATGSAVNGKQANCRSRLHQISLDNFCAGGDLYKTKREREEASRDSLFHYNLDAPCCLSLRFLSSFP